MVADSTKCQAQLESQFDELSEVLLQKGIPDPLPVLFEATNAVLDKLHDEKNEGFAFLNTRLLNHFGKLKDIKSRARKLIVGTNNDGLLQNVPCEVAIRSRKEQKWFRRDWFVNLVLSWAWRYGFAQGVTTGQEQSKEALEEAQKTIADMAKSAASAAEEAEAAKAKAVEYAIAATTTEVLTSARQLMDDESYSRLYYEFVSTPAEQ
jgi:hypothetical protein